MTILFIVSMNQVSRIIANQSMDSYNRPFYCPLEGIIDMVTKKWAMLIVAVLKFENDLGFNQLLDKLFNISPKSLSDTLKSLEKIGIVKREVIQGPPVRVKYHLTEEGEKLGQVLLPLLEWASNHSDQNTCKIIELFSGSKD
jgi:DNA-binding HxlR family transcriptional regulator